MDYMKHYSELIGTRKLLGRKKSKTEYYENHHSIPKWLGGDNSKDNMVLLTAREHFIAHWLLWKHYRDRPSALAFHRMTRSNNDNQQRNFTSKQFELARNAHSESQKGINNHMFGKPSPNRGKPGVCRGVSRPELSKRMSGENNPAKKSESRKAISSALSGVPKSESHKASMSTAALKIEKTKCTYCDVIVDNRNFARWHGNNCKMNVNGARFYLKVQPETKPRGQLHCEWCDKSFDIMSYGHWHGDQCSLNPNSERALASIPKAPIIVASTTPESPVS